MDIEKNRMAMRSARMKITAMSLVLGVVFVLSLGFLAQRYMKESEAQRLSYLKQTVELARNTIEPILVEYREHRISESEAMTRVRSLVRKMVYEDEAGKNYIFMSSYDGHMLVQPYEPEKELTNVWDLKDSYGVHIIRSLVETAASAPGRGYVSYHYFKPGSDRPEEKISYVIGIPELKCYIGTGQYMTDIRSAQQQYIISIAALTAIMLLLLLLLVYYSMTEVRRQNVLLHSENIALKRVEETLRASETRFRKLFNIAAIPLCLVDGEGRIMDYNEKYHQTFGYDHNDLPTLNEWWRLAYPDSDYRTWVIDTWSAAVKKAKRENVDIEPIEYLVTCKNGEVKNIIISGTTFDDYFLATLIDITERKKAEELLKASEEKYRHLVENAEESIFVAQDGRLTFGNPKTEKIIGRTMEYVSSHPFTDFIHPDDRQMVLDRHIRRMHGEDVTTNYEFRVIRSDGEIRWVDLKVVLIEWEERKASLNFLSDITDRKRAEEEKNRLESQLRQSQKMEAIGILAGGIAHDFNNLLQAINGYTQLLLLRHIQNDRDQANLLGIQSAADRAAKLVRQLLLFSRKVETVRKPIDLNQVIDYVQKLLERTIPKMVNIMLRPAPDLWTINADQVQIEQIILNLGVNAADAMPEGGDLVIETKNMDPKLVSMPNGAAATVDRMVQLTISDTGQGMDRQTVEHIFEPFYTTKEIGKGTGLGLASAYGIVQNHGGQIVCESRLGQGTTFHIFLPAIGSSGMKPAGTDPDDLSDKEPDLGGTETILLVDDEKPILDFASQALTSFGYTVITRSTGEDALTIFVEKLNDIDLVILDIGMPGMGGARCLREMAKMKPEVKVVVASGYPLNGHVDRTLEAAAAGYVGKPYKVRELLDMIRQVLDKDA